MYFKNRNAVERYKFNNISCVLTLTKWLGEEEAARWWKCYVRPSVNHLITGPVITSLESLSAEIVFCASALELSNHKKTRFKNEEFPTGLKVLYLATQIIASTFSGLVDLNAAGIVDETTENMSLPKALLQSRYVHKWDKTKRSPKTVNIKGLTRKQIEGAAYFEQHLNECLSEISRQCGMEHTARIWSNIVVPASEFIDGRTNLYVEHEGYKDKGDAGAQAIQNLKAHIQSLIYSAKDIEDDIKIDHDFFADSMIDSAWKVYSMQEYIRRYGLSFKIDRIVSPGEALWTQFGAGKC